MRIQTHRLTSPTPGTVRELTSLHFGNPGQGAKALIQASLHADEIPAMLVAHHLRQRLQRLEDLGQVIGEVVLVPAANPIGLSQRLLQNGMGRFELASGENFNRHYADLLDRVCALVDGQLTAVAADNVTRIRAALRVACAELPVETELQSLRKTLLTLATDADVVLDLHCDSEAVMHLYTATPLWPRVEPLARLLGAQLSLLALQSGGDPFDEACSMLWPRLAERFAAKGIPADAVPCACAAVTVELRGETDVRHTLAEPDADALIAYLAHCGIVASAAAAPLPALLREPMPLAGSVPITAPRGGVLVFVREVGDMVAKGDLIGDLVDPMSGEVTPLVSPIDGLLYAHESRRFAYAGMRVAKVAGVQAVRSGKLLSA